MRTPLLAALALLALAPAAPASAEPLRLDEGRLAGVAAGQVDLPATPSFSFSDVTSSSTRTDTSNTTNTNIGQSIFGSADNTNNALGVSSADVTAQGSAAAMLVGTISAARVP